MNLRTAWFLVQSLFAPIIEREDHMTGVTFDYLNRPISPALATAATPLKTKVPNLDPAQVSPTELLMLQQEVSKWTMMTQIQSTLVKELSDTMKGIIQKSG